MVKLVGCLCILTGGTLAWWLQMAERRRQREALNDMLCALRRTAEEIRMARTPLPALWGKLALDCGSDVGVFFQRLAEAAEQGCEIPKVWQAETRNLPLPPELRNIIAELGRELHGDEENICKVISLVTYELAKHSTKMQEERRMEEQRTTALCFSGAALLIILLI